MAIFKIVFTNEAVDYSEQSGAPHSFIFRIDASSVDEAIGLSQIEFTQKQPQLKHADYVPHAVPDDGNSAQRIRSFDVSRVFNPDQ